jgi:hypothetical protein
MVLLGIMLVSRKNIIIKKLGSFTICCYFSQFPFTEWSRDVATQLDGRYITLRTAKFSRLDDQLPVLFGTNREKSREVCGGEVHHSV